MKIENMLQRFSCISFLLKLLWFQSPHDFTLFMHNSYNLNKIIISFSMMYIIKVCWAMTRYFSYSSKYFSIWLQSLEYLRNHQSLYREHFQRKAAAVWIIQRYTLSLNGGKITPKPKLYWLSSAQNENTTVVTTGTIDNEVVLPTYMNSWWQRVPNPPILWRTSLYCLPPPPHPTLFSKFCLFKSLILVVLFPWLNRWSCHIWCVILLKACVRYFLSKFYFLSNDNPSKSMKNVFYFI